MAKHIENLLKIKTGFYIQRSIYREGGRFSLLSFSAYDGLQKKVTITFSSLVCSDKEESISLLFESGMGL